MDRPLFSTVKAKLLALLVTSIALTTLLVGLFLGFGVRHFHEQQTRRAFQSAAEAVKGEIQARQDRLDQLLFSLATDSAVMVGLNMISGYARPENYDAVVFDPEKRRLARDLARHSLVFPEITVLAADLQEELAVFASNADSGYVEGYQTYGEGRARTLVNESMFDPQWTGGQQPDGALPYLRLYRGSERFRRVVGHPRGLNLVAGTPVMRLGTLENGPRRVGRLVAVQRLEQDFFDAMTRLARVKVNFAGQGNPFLDELGIPALARTPPLFPERQEAGEGNELPGWSETRQHFLQVFQLPVQGEGSPVYVVFSVEKAEVDQAVRQTVLILLAILLVSGIIVLPVGWHLAQSAIAAPIAGLVEDVQCIRAGAPLPIPRPGRKGGRGGEFGELRGALRELASAIQDRETRLQIWARILEESREAIFITDADTRILLVNRAFTKITGYAPEEVIGKLPSILSSGRHDREFYGALWASLNQTGHWQGEIWDRTREGRIYPQWASITAVAEKQGKVSHYIAIFSDLSEHKATQEYIHFLAYHDPLTELPNRALLGDRLAMAISLAQREGCLMAVVVLGLDRFKNINDSLGPTVGDELLRGLALRLKASLRESDTVSRFGGDTFTILLNRVQRVEDVAVVVDNLMQAITLPFSIHGRELRVTASVGISVYPDDALDPDGLLKDADSAMYYAKQRGRNNYQFFKPQMNERALERLSLENDMRGALDRGELQLYYQPQLDLRTGELIGVEALIRWLRPAENGELTLVPPKDFIPLAEETGLILPIGDWVLLEAIRQQQVWLAAGLPRVTIAVNISAVQFRQSGIEAFLLQTAQDQMILPGSIELELTESIVMEDPERVGAILGAIKRAGYRLAIDDFGTGYSSLSYLKRFPLDKLKIDASFVLDIAHDSADLAIVHAVVSLGHSLGLRVLAEGVEGPQELSLLQGMGCDEAQGYHYCRPVPGADFLRWYGEYFGKSGENP